MVKRGKNHRGTEGTDVGLGARVMQTMRLVKIYGMGNKVDGAG